MRTIEWYEKEILIHRFLYYVMADPIISDFEYDMLEREARSACDDDSVVQGVGSCLPSSYPAEVKLAAIDRIQQHQATLAAGVAGVLGLPG